MSETTYNTGITDDQIRAINARAMQAVDRDAELETLRDERDRLREALRPFAERWEYFERTKHPSGGEWPEDLEYADDEPSAIYLGQLKAAKAALTPAGGAPQRWTREKPTEPGWYWYREELDAQPALYPVEWKPVWKCWGIPGKRVDEMLGEWQGPLTPNEATE